MQKLATVVAVSMALASSAAHALGLGEIEMRSALNQPMDATIPLTSVQQGEADGMIVKLASPEAFARAGIDRNAVLTDLRFSMDYSGPSPVIRISSARPVVEPFLNFLLEIDWPQGRMVREYTVLLDPPVFMSANAAAPGTVTPAPAPVTRAAPAPLGSAPIERDAAAADFEFDVAVGDDAMAEVGDVAINDDVLVEEVALEGGELISIEEFDVSATDVLTAEPLAEAAPSGGSIKFSQPIPLSEFQARERAAGRLADAPVDNGDVVVLSDLAAPNTEALDEFDVAVFDGGEVEDGDIAEGGEVIAFEEFAGDSGTMAASAGGNVTVDRGDTLFEIAEANAIDGVSTQQMMLALLDANRNAFINGNINLVRAGAVLRIPERNEALALSQAEAVAEVADQAKLWQEYRDSVRGRATRMADSGEARLAPRAERMPAEEIADAAAPAENLSSGAREILEQARRELEASQGRNELNIVADNESAETVASATSDESSASASGRLAEINKKLQLAREELASSRRAAGDLGEQVNELESTEENLGALATMQQNEIARLEQQLRDAREQGNAAVEGAGDELVAMTDLAEGAMDDVGNMAGDAMQGAENMADGAMSAAGEMAADAGNAMESGVDALGSAAGDLASGAADMAADATDAAGDLASGAGEAVDEVFSTAGGADNAAAEPWYKKLLGGGMLMPLLGGLGALLVGLFAILFWRPRRGGEVDESELDEVEFHDEDANEAAAATAPAASLSDETDHDIAADHAVADDTLSQTVATAPAMADEAGGSVDGDDTIAEAEVFLAYGLHDQAEDLLKNAVGSHPENAEYQAKLLEVYHAQGNNEGFSKAASEFRDRFGATHPAWAGIAAKGYELAPGNALFASAEGIESVGKGDFDAPKLDDNDFFSSDSAADSTGTSRAVSQRRDFSQAEDSPSSANDGEMLDQSLDPAFAFDETDLEATGDFSKIADDIAAENEANNDTGGFSGISAALGGAAAAGVAGVTGAAASLTEDAGDALDFDANTEFHSANTDGAIGSIADGGLASSASDLTLDLDQLSSDMELDSTELLDDSIGSNVSDLEVPDLNDTGIGGLSLDGEADEMDTMLDLAKAYIDMGDKDSASSALDEIVKSGSPEQKSEAETLLRKIS